MTRRQVAEPLEPHEIEIQHGVHVQEAGLAVLIKTLGCDLPRGNGRELVVDRDRVYELDGEDSRTLAAVGAFRFVPDHDLDVPRDTLDNLHDHRLVDLGEGARADPFGLCGEPQFRQLEPIDELAAPARRAQDRGVAPDNTRLDVGGGFYSWRLGRNSQLFDQGRLKTPSTQPIHSQSLRSGLTEAAAKLCPKFVYRRRQP